jgi:hypothetical protein
MYIYKMYIQYIHICVNIPGVPQKNWTLFDFMERKSYRNEILKIVAFRKD